MVFDDTSVLTLTHSRSPLLGDLSDSEHLKFWLTMLRTANLMKNPGRPAPTVGELIKSAEDLAETARIFADLDLTPDAASLLHGPLLVRLGAYPTAIVGVMSC